MFPTKKTAFIPSPLPYPMIGSLWPSYRIGRKLPFNLCIGLDSGFFYRIFRGPYYNFLQRYNKKNPKNGQLTPINKLAKDNSTTRFVFKQNKAYNFVPGNLWFDRWKKGFLPLYHIYFSRKFWKNWVCDGLKFWYQMLVKSDLLVNCWMQRGREV